MNTFLLPLKILHFPILSILFFLIQINLQSILFFLALLSTGVLFRLILLTLSFPLHVLMFILQFQPIVHHLWNSLLLLHIARRENHFSLFRILFSIDLMVTILRITMRLFFLKLACPT